MGPTIGILLICLITATDAQTRPAKPEPAKAKAGVTVVFNQEGWDKAVQLVLHRNGQFSSTLGRMVDDKKLNQYCLVPEGEIPRFILLVFDPDQTTVGTVEQAIAKIRVAAVKEKVKVEINLVFPGLKE